MQFRFVIFGLLLAIAVIAGINYWSTHRSGSAAVAPAGETRPQAPSADESDARAPDGRTQADAPGNSGSHLSPIAGDAQNVPPAAQPALPSLDDADAWLLARIATSMPAPWEDEPELLRTFSAVLDNAPRGDYPRNLLAFLAPEGRFKVLRAGSQIRLDPVSYDRYNAVVAALTDLSPQAMAGLFGQLEPLLLEALAELGVTNAQPGELAAAAIAHVQATPILDEPPLLVQPKVIFKFADARLEKLSPLQKQLLRMGPANLGVVKLWLGEFAAQLE